MNIKQLKINLALGFSFVSLLLIGVLLYLQLSRPQVAYVRSQDLIYKYAGMMEAHQAYKSKTKQWQANVDTLKKEYQRMAKNYKTNREHLSEQERKQQEEQLREKQQELARYSKAVQQKAEKEDQEITIGVLNQVNSFVKQYAEENGYDVIFGTTKAGNLLYGNRGLDITDQVLTELNKEYQDS